MESIHPRYTYLNNSCCAMEDPCYSLGLCETETLFRLYDVRVEIGSLVRQYKDEFLVAWEGPPKGVAFTVDPSSRACRFCLTQNTAVSYSGRRDKRVRTYCDYKVEFLIRDICEYIYFENKEMDFVILLRLSSSPCVWCRSPHESWSRTTDFTASGAIGRSNVYKFVIPRRYVAEWNKATDYLRQLRVMKFDVRWPLVIEKEPYFGMPSSSFFYSIGNKFGICFEVIFLVNAVMHKGILNQHRLSDSDGFFDLLRSQSKDVNVAALNYLYSCSRRPVFDACQRLRDLQDWFVANPELFNRPKRLDHPAHVRKLVITPTRAYCIPPEAQLSNRVLRKYKVIGDRFLRVTFMDKGIQTIYSNSMNSYVYNSCPQRTKVSRRVEAILKNGFDFCGRNFWKGYRPHSNEASGSDLDGDLYFVTWDENLIPPSMKSEEPMDFDAAEAKNLERPVTNQDIIEFFVRNMANENLGAICNAHVVHADRSEDGAKDTDCIKLAKLAAIAVDMPKTGKIVRMPPHLRPESYPDFMGKEGFNSYMSTKILGELYRQITDAYDEDMATSVKLGCTYDSHLVVPGAHNIIPEALERKCSYDFQLKALMGQYNVLREEEIVTGYIWSMPKSRKRGELQDQLKQAYSALKKEFRECFERINGDFKSMSDDQKNFMYEQKASAWYMVTYHPKLVEKSLYLQGPDGPGDVPMLSFAWIATDYLARIKIRRSGVEKINSRKPINTLRRYLADRIGTEI
ncbi:hypothetical protein ACLB2K_019355 [Fragaria x ananassa]